MQALPDQSLIEEKLTLFDQICLMARDRNDAWFAAKTGFNVRQGLYTPASKLAEEGDKHSVLFLIKYGANIHEAAWGASMGKQYALAETLRTYYGANVNFIAKGICMAKELSSTDVDYLNFLIKKHHADLPLMAMAAATKGDFDFAEQSLSKYKTQVKAQEYQADKIQGFVAGIIQGALLYGVCEYAKQLIHDYKLDMESVFKFLAPTADVTLIEAISPHNGRWLAWLAALRGNEAYCVQLMEDKQWNMDEQYRREVIEGIIAGSFLGEHIQIIQNLNFFGTFSSDDLQKDRFYKISCVSKHTCGLLEQNKFFIPFAVASGYLETAIIVYNQTDPEFDDKRRKILQGIEDGLTQSFFYSNTTVTLHQLSFINDHAFLNILKSRKSLPTYLKNIIPMAIKINQMMRKYEIDFDQARAFLSCAALRKFFLYFPFMLSDAILLTMADMASLPLGSVKVLYDKVSLYVNKSFLADDIAKYQSKSWISHRARADSLLLASEQAKNCKEFSELIRSQYGLFHCTNNPTGNVGSYHQQSLTNTGKGDYYQIVEKHALRMGI